jgi:gamma-glutamyltranspeptidase/glutathione hydrolase
VASPHYLASSAGLATLTSGGTAADAAVAMNLVLAVVYPHMCGLGGDLIAMVWHDGDPVGLNSTGRLPAAARPVADVPRTGIQSVTVPGCIAGLRALHARFGSLPWDDLVRPAISCAREGVPKAPGLERVTGYMRPLLEKDAEAARTFLPTGPLVQPQLADTLEHLDEFYQRIGERAPEPFTTTDFTSHEASWVEPRHTTWLGLEVCEMPPNSRGHLALDALDRLEPLDGLTPNDAEWHRRLIRALEGADADGAYHPDGRSSTGRVRAAEGVSGDTVYLCAVDESGMAVSMNQSLKDAFGSGVMVPGTGVLLQNRAADFTPETYLPGAAVPAHTLAPAMALQGGRPKLVFGTMGGPSQLQVHLQLLARIFVAGEDVADAVGAPRWRITKRGLIADPGLPDLGQEPAPMPDLLGHAHAISREDGVLTAASDPRSDGAALGY